MESPPSFSKTRIGIEYVNGWFAMFGFSVGAIYILDLFRDVSKFTDGFGSTIGYAAFVATFTIIRPIYKFWLYGYGKTGQDASLQNPQ